MVTFLRCYAVNRMFRLLFSIDFNSVTRLKWNIKLEKGFQTR